jgi:hypothetical protein
MEFIGYGAVNGKIEIHILRQLLPVATQPAVVLEESDQVVRSRGVVIKLGA